MWCDIIYIYTYLHLQIIICIWYIHALYPLHHSSITQQWWSWPRDPAGPWRVEAMRTSCRTRESGKPRADSVEHNWLVVWNINFIFPYIGNVIIPTDFHIFQRGGSTTNQIMWFNGYWMILGHYWDTINIFRCWLLEAFKGFKDGFKRAVQWYCRYCTLWSLWFYSVKKCRD